MAQDQEETNVRRCPRCGGRMIKLPGSSLFWHADNNHPRCEITNIVDTPASITTQEQPPEEPPKARRSKK